MYTGCPRALMAGARFTSGRLRVNEGAATSLRRVPQHNE